jgi:hypothetical protein
MKTKSKDEKVDELRPEYDLPALLKEGIQERWLRMESTLNLDQMTVADKLATMERLWEDLGRTPEVIPSPSWHGEVLSAREARISEGKATFAPLDEVKERIRKAVS